MFDFHGKDGGDPLERVAASYTSEDYAKISAQAPGFSVVDSLDYLTGIICRICHANAIAHSRIRRQ